MKKLFLTAAALALAPAAFAQVEIGLKVSPSISYFRPSSASPYNFQGDGGKFSFGGGVFMDYFFGENYAFNTGLFLTGKGGSYSYQEQLRSTGTPVYQTVSQELSIQYLEIPATIKLFTNEVSPDTRVYFQVGGSLAFPVQSRIGGAKYYTDPYSGDQTSASDHVFAVDVNLIGGVGAEYKLGSSTKVFAGISYHHGLIDLDRYFENTRKFSDVAIKNSVVALDFGLKF